MKKELTESTLKKITIVPIALGVLSAVSAAFQVSQGTTWTSGEYVYASWTSCNNSEMATDPCTYGISAFSFEKAWPGFAISVVLLAIGFFVLFSSRLRLQIIGKLKRPYSRLQNSIAENSKSRDLRKAAQKEMDEVAEATKARAPKYVLVARRNYSLVSFKSGTSTMVAFGIVAGIIGFIAQNNDSTSGIVASVAFSGISQLLLVLGFGGKLLIATAKVILEGLDGNFRETDKFEEQSKQDD